MPAFSMFFGLKPQDFEDMTVDEVAVYMEALAELQREHRRSSRG